LRRGGRYKKEKVKMKGWKCEEEERVGQLSRLTARREGWRG